MSNFETPMVNSAEFFGLTPGTPEYEDFHASEIIDIVNSSKDDPDSAQFHVQNDQFTYPIGQVPTVLGPRVLGPGEKMLPGVSYSPPQLAAPRKISFKKKP